MAESERAVSLVIADDQRVVRDGLRSLLELLGFAVAAVAADGSEALAAVAEHDPDVLLTDLRMPGTDGVAAIAELTRSRSRTRAVALTTYDDDATVRDALRAGALGFLTKDADPDTIAAAVRAAAQGRSLLDAAAHRALLTGAFGPAPAPSPAPSAGLTVREVEVLRLIAAGLSNQQISRELVLTVATVKTHVNHLLAKTRCRDRAALVSYAYGHGLT